MALQSQLFRGDQKLEAAAVSDPAHIFQGARGPHVGKIQKALIQLDGAAIAPDGVYGPSTANAVSAFKQARQILNFQGKIDNIVGKKTTVALDSEMFALERGAAPPSPSPGTAVVRRGVNSVGGGTPPVILGRPLDIFVQFPGALGPLEGTVDTAAQLQFSVKTNTPAYLATHLPVLPIIFNGGTGANDKSAAAVALVLAARAITPNGVTVVLGESSGGLVALKAAILLNGLQIALDYLGISDGAFFSPGSVSFTSGTPQFVPPGSSVTAGKVDNFFQTVGHNMLKTQKAGNIGGFMAGTEFHLPLPPTFIKNVNNVDMLPLTQGLKDLQTDFDSIFSVNRRKSLFEIKTNFADPAHVVGSRAAEKLAAKAVDDLIKP